MPDTGSTATESEIEPPDLSHPRYENALTLHMAALNALLGDVPGLADPEDELFRHEFRYMARAARKRGLNRPGVLSINPDDDSRNAETLSLLGKAVAGLVLAGPCDHDRAIGIAALACRPGHEAMAPFVRDWLRSLYPGDGEDVGPVQPDRLGELIVARLIDDALLDRFVTDADTVGRMHMLVVLCRVALRKDLRQTLSVLFGRHLDPLAFLAPHAATLVDDPAPLADALIHAPRECRGIVDDGLRRALADPHWDVRRAMTTAVQVARFALNVVEARPGRDPAELPLLSEIHFNLGRWLAELGEYDEVLVHRLETLRIERELAARSPSGSTNLLAAMSSYIEELNRLGDRPSALKLAEEALELAVRRTDGDLTSDLDRAVAQTQLAKLSPPDQAAELLAAAAAAVHLALAGLSLASGEAGLRLPRYEASRLHQAVTILEEHARFLSHEGDDAEAGEALKKALPVLRELWKLEPEVYWRSLARLSGDYAEVKFRLGDHETAEALYVVAIGLMHDHAGSPGEEATQDAAGAYMRYALFLSARDRLEEAFDIAERATPWMYAGLDDKAAPATTVGLGVGLAWLLSRQGHHDEALNLFARALELGQAVFDAGSEKYLRLLFMEAMCLIEAGRYLDALDSLIDVIELSGDEADKKLISDVTDLLITIYEHEPERTDEACLTTMGATLTEILQDTAE